MLSRATVLKRSRFTCVGLTGEMQWMKLLFCLFTNTCNVLTFFQMLTIRLCLHNMMHCPCRALNNGA